LVTTNNFGGTARGIYFIIKMARKKIKQRSPYRVGGRMRSVEIKVKKTSKKD